MTPEEQTSFLDFKKRLDESYRSLSSAAKSDTQMSESEASVLGKTMTIQLSNMGEPSQGAN